MRAMWNWDLRNLEFEHGSDWAFRFMSCLGRRHRIAVPRLHGEQGAPQGRRRGQERELRPGGVAYYRTAVQASPNNPNYKIALQRAMLVASRVHLDRARKTTRTTISSRPRAVSTSSPASTTRATDTRRSRSPRSISDPRPHRSDAAAPARRASREPRAPGVGAATLNPASREPLVTAPHERARRRHPDRHRQRERHQRQLRPRRAGAGIIDRPQSSTSTASRSNRRSTW